LNYLIAKVLFSVGAGDRPIGAEFSIQASSTALKKVKQNRRSGKKQQLIYQWTSRPFPAFPMEHASVEILSATPMLSALSFSTSRKS
jgi:hypothetical protein